MKTSSIQLESLIASVDQPVDRVILFLALGNYDAPYTLCYEGRGDCPWSICKCGIPIAAFSSLLEAAAYLKSREK